MMMQNKRKWRQFKKNYYDVQIYVASIQSYRAEVTARYSRVHICNF